MKRLPSFILSAPLCAALAMLLAIPVPAQTKARQEIHENLRRSGSNYLDYIVPTEPLTKAPKGYEPFYISHYGRHGSRWLLSKRDYLDVLDVLREADSHGKLTDVGCEVMARVEEVFATSDGRLGDLTTVGERQHHGIGRRMARNFPEVFSGNAQVDARSTVVIRCILSMTAECEELCAFNPQLSVHNDVSESFQGYLNCWPYPKSVQRALADGYEIIEDYARKCTSTERICDVLFSDSQYVFDNVNAGKFVRDLFDVAGNMQSHDGAPSLYDVFTEEELYDLWKWRNVQWYVEYGNAPATHSMSPFSQCRLLDNIIATADTVVGNRAFHGATLRFGHEVVVLPLASLLELGEAAEKVENLDTLDAVFANYRVIPMAANIQLVFYRPKKGEGDVLVKALLNEREVAMPVPTDSYPYYRWEALREYYTGKLARFREQDEKQ